MMTLEAILQFYETLHHTACAREKAKEITLSGFSTNKDGNFNSLSRPKGKFNCCQLITVITPQNENSKLKRRK